MNDDGCTLMLLLIIDGLVLVLAGYTAVHYLL